ncbi:MAG: hypothetical protein R3B47_10085 [Bacteroidia bacterium]
MRKTFTFLIVALLGLSGTAFGQTPNLTLSMANATLTGVAPNQTLEFDIMMTCSQAGTYLSSGQIYVNYNTTAFGSSVVTNGNFAATRGQLLSEQNATMTGFKYALGNPVDNTTNRVTSNFFTFSFTPPNTSDYTEVPTVATPSWHFAFDIANISQLAGLTFDALSNGQFFYVGATGFPSPYNLILGADYSTLDLSNIPQLPLEGLILRAFPEKRSITLDWTIEREINNKGFFVQRSGDDLQYSQLGWVDGAGDATNTRYSFVDQSAGPNKTYYYRLQQVDIDGSVHYSSVIQSRIDASERLFVQVCPNPVTGKEAVVKITMPEEGEVEAQVPSPTIPAKPLLPALGPCSEAPQASAFQ